MASLLLASTPVHGHVGPVLGIAAHLVDAGHRVRVLTGSRFDAAIRATGATPLPLPQAADYDDRDLDASFPRRRGLRGLALLRHDLEHVFLGPVAAQHAALVAAVAAEPTDVVLAETMFGGAGAFAIGRGAGDPAVVSAGVIPLMLPSRDTAPFGLGLPPMAGRIGRLRNAALSLLAQRVLLDDVRRRAIARLEAITGRAVPTDPMCWADLVDALVQCTVPGFEYPRSDLPEHVSFVGPVAPPAAVAPVLPEWWSELAGAQRVVHVTQGTIANRDLSALVLPTVRALADEPGTLVVVATGGRPVADLGALPANVRAAEYLPYDRLLPFVDVLVTNGGYGGVHQALAHGVPLVVAGTTEDKPEVAARVAWSGAGLDLRTARPGAAVVGRAVRRVLADDRFAASAARLGAAISASPGAAGIEQVLLAAVARRGADRAGVSAGR